MRYNARIAVSQLTDADDLNPQLAEAFAQLQERDFSRRSHFIEGRYENLYLEPDRLPGLGRILDFAQEQARHFIGSQANDGLGQAPARSTPLRLGFWLNAMQQGQRTSRHNHEEADELCSGVYYVSAPPQAGDILFHDGPFQTRVQPQPGMMLLFSPALVHSVEPNLSQAQRLSIAFNIGPEQD